MVLLLFKVTDVFEAQNFERSNQRIVFNFNQIFSLQRHFIAKHTLNDFKELLNQQIHTIITVTIGRQLKYNSNITFQKFFFWRKPCIKCTILFSSDFSIAKNIRISCFWLFSVYPFQKNSKKILLHSCLREKLVRIHYLDWGI